MKLSHKKKVKLARKMMTPEEITEHIPIFSSKAWTKRRFLRMLPKAKAKPEEVKPVKKELVHRYPEKVIIKKETLWLKIKKMFWKIFGTKH